MESRRILARRAESERICYAQAPCPPGRAEDSSPRREPCGSGAERAQALVRA